MRRLGLPRGARGSARNREPLEVERDDQVLTLGTGDAEGSVVRKPLAWVAREDRVPDALANAGDDPITKSRLARRLGGPTLSRDLQGQAEAHDPGDVLGAGAPPFLLPTPGLDRGDPGAAADVQGTDALRPVELVRVHRQQVDGDLSNVDVERSNALHRVAVEAHAALAAHRADRGDRLERADLVVRVHHRDERGVRVDRLADRVHGDDAVRIDADDPQPHRLVPLQIACGVDHRVVLDGRRHQTVTLAATRLQHAAQREVVGLGPPAGEDDLRRVRTDRGGDLLARPVDGRSRRAPLRVDARGVPGDVSQGARHRLGDGGVDRGGGGVVEVHPVHDVKSSSHAPLARRCCGVRRPRAGARRRAHLREWPTAATTAAAAPRAAARAD